MVNAQRPSPSPTKTHRWDKEKLTKTHHLLALLVAGYAIVAVIITLLLVYLPGQTGIAGATIVLLASLISLGWFTRTHPASTRRVMAWTAGFLACFGLVTIVEVVLSILGMGTWTIWTCGGIAVVAALGFGHMIDHCTPRSSAAAHS